MKSLKASGNKFSDEHYQLEVIESHRNEDGEFISFKDKLENIGMYPLKPTEIEIFQINVGKMCNQTCKHCHVDAGPDRQEIMTRETMQQCIDVIAANDSIHTIDLTGGAPEMNPDFRWFVEHMSALGKKVIVRCNLTIILANKKYHDLPEFFKKHNIEVVSSLPYFNAARTDSQRGDGVFEKSIKALQMLNKVGYGVEGSGLTLNLVYNPAGAFLPGDQKALQDEFKTQLLDHYNIVFNELFTITNLPVSRFLEYLIRTENYDEYMEKLITSFNPAAVQGVMCRNTISVGWDGFLYDCDFNQMLDLKIENGKTMHLSNYNTEFLQKRNIIINEHCFGCTAGAGSSCGGATA